jgi:hypothetical protein
MALSVSSSNGLSLTELELEHLTSYFYKSLEFLLLCGASAVNGGRVFVMGQGNRAGVLDVSRVDYTRNLSRKAAQRYLQEVFCHLAGKRGKEASERRLLMSHFGVPIRDSIVA